MYDFHSRSLPPTHHHHHHHQPTTVMSITMDSIDDNKTDGSDVANNKKNDEKEEEQSFLLFLRTSLRSDPLYPKFTEVFDVAPTCILKWRRRFQQHHPEIWRRLFDKDKIVKEFVEAAPVLDAVIRYVNDSSDLGNGNGDDDDDDSEGHKNASSSSSYTIIDLACGKGYLSMILSEILPPAKINRIVLMDKAWPMRNQPVDPQRHINWEHIYGPASVPTPSSPTKDCFPSTNENPTPLLCQEVCDGNEHNNGNGSSLPPSPPPPPPPTFAAWPIRLDTSKQDLKASRQLANIHKHYLSDPNHPVIILAIHFCGTLSMKAVELFNGIRTGDTTDSNTTTNNTNNKNNVHLLALKPCCLPGMVHAKRKEQFKLGDHTFDSVEVCTHGKWKKNKWVGGPPRSHLKDRFQTWSHHLYCGIRTTTESTSTSTSTSTPAPELGKQEDNENRGDNASDTKNSSIDDGTVVKMHTRVMVQHDGGFQNDFLFAERRQKRKRKTPMDHPIPGSTNDDNSSPGTVGTVDDDDDDDETDMWQTLHARTDVIDSNCCSDMVVSSSSSQS